LKYCSCTDVLLLESRWWIGIPAMVVIGISQLTSLHSTNPPYCNETFVMYCCPKNNCSPEVLCAIKYVHKTWLSQVEINVKFLIFAGTVSCHYKTIVGVSHYTQTTDLLSKLTSISACSCKTGDHGASNHQRSGAPAASTITVH